MRLGYTSLAAVFMAAIAAGSALGEDWVDNREPTTRSAQEQAFVFEQMRLFVSSLADLQDDLAKGDMTKAAADAAPRGAKASAKIAKPPHLAEKESDAWKQMMKVVRVGFDEIADRAAAGASKEEVLGITARTMSACVACHQTYRVVVSEN